MGACERAWEKEESTWHIRWNSPSSGWMPKSPDASKGTLPNQPLALCKNILWPRKHKLADMFFNDIQKTEQKGENQISVHGMKKYLVQIHIYMPKYYTCVMKDSEVINSYAYAAHTSRRSILLRR